MNCIIIAMTLVLVGVAAALPTSEVVPECNLGASIGATASCFLADNTVRELTGDDNLGVLEVLEATDWDAYAQQCGNGNEEQCREAWKAILEPMGGYDVLKASFAFLVDDATEGPDAIEVRGKICHAIKHLLQCQNDNIMNCRDKATQRLRSGLLRKLMMSESDFHLDEHFNFDSVHSLMEINTCHLCDNDGHALQVILQSVANAQKREALKHFKCEANRIAVYANCPAANDVSAADINRAYIISLADSNPCQLHPYMMCLCNAIHERVNPEEPQNVLCELFNMSFHHLLHCDAAQVPSTYNTCAAETTAA